MRIFGGIKNLSLAAYRSYFSMPNVKRLEDFCRPYVNSSRRETKALDLGCGQTPKNPFYSSDLFGLDVDYGVNESAKIYACDLGIEKIPFDDDTFDYITAFDLLEHIPRLTYKDGIRIYPFIHLMSEIHRVLKKDGIFLSDTPAYPRFSAFTDPTHVNIITNQTFKMYFCHPFNWAQRYGFDGGFNLVKQGWCKENLLTMMSK